MITSNVCDDYFKDRRSIPIKNYLLLKTFAYDIKLAAAGPNELYNVPVRARSKNGESQEH